MVYIAISLERDGCRLLARASHVQGFSRTHSRGHSWISTLWGPEDTLLWCHRRSGYRWDSDRVRLLAVQTTKPTDDSDRILEIYRIHTSRNPSYPDLSDQDLTQKSYSIQKVERVFKCKINGDMPRHPFSPCGRFFVIYQGSGFKIFSFKTSKRSGELSVISTYNKPVYLSWYASVFRNIRGRPHFQIIKQGWLLLYKIEERHKKGATGGYIQKTIGEVLVISSPHSLTIDCSLSLPIRLYLANLCNWPTAKYAWGNELKFERKLSLFFHLFTFPAFQNNWNFAYQFVFMMKFFC